MQLNEASKIYVIINLTINCLQTVVMFFCYGCVIKGLYFSSIVYPETDRETTPEKKKLNVITLTLVTTGLLVGYTPHLLYFCAFLLTGKHRTEDFLHVANFFSCPV